VMEVASAVNMITTSSGICPGLGTNLAPNAQAFADLLGQLSAQLQNAAAIQSPGSNDPSSPATAPGIGLSLSQWLLTPAESGVNGLAGVVTGLTSLLTGKTGTIQTNQRTNVTDGQSAVTPGTEELKAKLDRIGDPLTWAIALALMGVLPPTIPATASQAASLNLNGELAPGGELASAASPADTGGAVVALANGQSAPSAQSINAANTLSGTSGMSIEMSEVMAVASGYQQVAQAAAPTANTVPGATASVPGTTDSNQSAATPASSADPGVHVQNNPPPLDLAAMSAYEPQGKQPATAAKASSAGVELSVAQTGVHIPDLQASAKPAIAGDTLATGNLRSDARSSEIRGAVRTSSALDGRDATAAKDMVTARTDTDRQPSVTLPQTAEMRSVVTAIQQTQAQTLAQAGQSPVASQITGSDGKPLSGSGLSDAPAAPTANATQAGQTGSTVTPVTSPSGAQSGDSGANGLQLAGSPALQASTGDGPQGFNQVLAMRLVNAVRRGEKECRLDLYPKELGHVDARLSFVDHRLNIVLTAESAEARQAIQAGLPELKQALEARGLQLGSFDLGSGGTGAGSAGQQNASQPGDRGYQNRAAWQDPTKPAPLTATPLPARPRRAGELDLMA
jgi:flagellar hook-length control protein FliK